MNILVAPDGTARCVYGEAVDLRALGHLELRRASFVEPDVQGRWHADLSPVSTGWRRPDRDQRSALTRPRAVLRAGPQPG